MKPSLSFLNLRIGNFSRQKKVLEYGRGTRKRKEKLKKGIAGENGSGAQDIRRWKIWSEELEKKGGGGGNIMIDDTPSVSFSSLPPSTFPFL